MEINNDYMNGYNYCIEQILRLINSELHNSKSGDTSINDALRFLRREILDTAYREFKS